MMKMSEEELAINGSLFFLYLGQLESLGIIEYVGGHRLSTAGYDTAMDAYESGHRLRPEDILGMLANTPGFGEDMHDCMLDLIWELQLDGYDEMKKALADVIAEHGDLS